MVAAKYSAIVPRQVIDLPDAIRLNGNGLMFQARPMWRIVLILLLAAAPATAQVKLTPKSTTTARSDPCAPIGRTADGKLVYSMKCEHLPAPPAPSPQAEVKETAPPATEPEPEVRRSGIFGWSYDRR